MKHLGLQTVLNNRIHHWPVNNSISPTGKTRNLQQIRLQHSIRYEGSLFAEGEQAIYSSIYKYEHTGLIPVHQRIAKYHPDINTLVIQFVNTTDFDGYTWNLSEIVYSRIVKILRTKKGS